MTQWQTQDQPDLLREDEVHLWITPLTTPPEKLFYFESVVSAGPAGVAAGASSTPVPPPVGKPEPGVKLGDGLANCQANDPAPDGTIVNGMRKVVRQTPFGAACSWEAVK